jgi:endo-1,4-beta-xylanase
MTKTIGRSNWHWAALGFVLTVMLVHTGVAQRVTNGGFESADTGAVPGVPVKGWLMFTGSGITPVTDFTIVSDSTKQGNRALKVVVHGIGSNDYDIQAVADSIPVTPGATYSFSVWAKSQTTGAKVNFTVGNYSYSEYRSIRPATLTKYWTKFTMVFTVSDNQTFIRAPIHFGYSVNTGNAIYIDNLRIEDLNVGKYPAIVEGESGVHGSNFPVLTSDGVTYTSVSSNSLTAASPGDSSRVITYHVAFPDSGSYNLFARVRVGANGYDDDSFFYGNGFGVKRDTASADWMIVDGLASAGFSDTAAVVGGPGTLGSGVWKWVNLKNAYQSTPGLSFRVHIDSLEKTFQIGGRENGLDIDKLAFGKVWLNFKVQDLDGALAGTPAIPDTSRIWTGPALGTGQSKFIGCAFESPSDTNFVKYWNQATPGNSGKFGSVAVARDTASWNWAALDAAYNFAQANHLVFKDHNLLWGQQQPAWLTGSGLDSAQKVQAVEQWIRMVGARYPDMDMIDVVNEPLTGHNPPDYRGVLGGAGSTGWDWVVWAFTKAREYLPHTKLLLNDFGIINENSATTSYLGIINILQSRGLIDGIGVQGHHFELESADTSVMRSNLDRLAATGLPIYISELDLGNLSDYGTPNDNVQLQMYQRVFPVLWKHRGVKGITFWGYREGEMWKPTCYLVRYTGTARPALLWLAQYIQSNPQTGVEDAPATTPSQFSLEQNYPNPFNPTTSIGYSVGVVGLPAGQAGGQSSVSSSHVRLAVYDLLGREVAVLVDEGKQPGVYTATWNAAGMASGVYFYRLTAGNSVATRKLIVLK